MQRYAPAVLAAFIAATVTLTGWLVLSQPMPEPSKTVEVAIIQGNKEHEVNVSAEYIKDAFFAYVGMSREAAEKEVDLIIWPETTIVDVVTESGWGGLISELAKMTNTSYIVGGYDRADDPSCPLSHNGAHFYNQHGEKIGVYRKVRLVPFGEFVPLRDKLPLLNNYGIRNTDVLPGKSHKLIDTQFGKAGVSICFESLFPHISRSETKRGAEMLFVLTNDSWFKRTPAAHQHLMMSQLRAIENSRWIVRAAATGESALIDPNGRVVKMLPIYEKGILIGEVAPREDVTIFTHLGDYFAYLSIAAVMLGLIKSINRRKLS